MTVEIYTVWFGGSASKQGGNGIPSPAAMRWRNVYAAAGVMGDRVFEAAEAGCTFVSRRGGLDLDIVF